MITKGPPVWNNCPIMDRKYVLLAIEKLYSEHKILYSDLLSAKQTVHFQLYDIDPVLAFGGTVDDKDKQRRANILLFEEELLKREITKNYQLDKQFKILLSIDD